MSNDRARLSFDATRRYRSVVAQQGRVTLEADVNEAQIIASENLIAETLDIVGPAGTPDDGFKVSAGTAVPDFTVGAGTMYVGGLRVTQEAAVAFGTQSEWLDNQGDPLAADDAAGRVDEFVYLFLREQEVAAVEDAPLREVALGGPDSGGRTRLLQRIVRTPAGGAACAPALKKTEAGWKALGLDFDPDTLRLSSSATLQVTYVQPPVAETQCDPQVLGGYLGADNQMIRVQISSIDELDKTFKLVWGYNNASFLHRCTAIDNMTLQLIAEPIDSYHAPALGKAVEVLRSAVKLDALPAEDNYIAAHSGVVTTPTKAYVPGVRQLSLPAALPAPYVSDTTPLFLRLWEAEIAFTPGKPVDLAGSGLQVTIALPGTPGALTVGQFWAFSVRPSTPAKMYPQRYFDAPQPPEGPRMWACPLAVIGWGSKGFELLNDCRNKFDNLVELTARDSGECCGITVTPAQVSGGAGLQALLDKHAGQRATIALRPGKYTLAAPLRLTAKHSGLVLEGCQPGVALSATDGKLDAFRDGLIVLTQTDNFTLRGLDIAVPLHHGADRIFSEAPAKQPAYTGIGVRAIQCGGLTVAECRFHVGTIAKAVIGAACIRAGGACPGLAIEDNVFEGPRSDNGSTLFLLGVMSGPEYPASGTAVKRNPNSGASLLEILLQDLSITGNRFGELTLAVWIRGEMGRIRCADNTALACNAGFYFAHTSFIGFHEAYTAAAQDYRSSPSQTYTAYGIQTASAQMFVYIAADDFAAATPLPSTTSGGTMVIKGKAPSASVMKRLQQEAVTTNKMLTESIEKLTKVQKTKSAKTKAVPELTEKALTTKISAKIVETSIAQNNGLTLGRPNDAPEISPVIRFSGNEIELLAGDGQTFDATADTGTLALKVLVDDRDGMSLIVNANQVFGSTQYQLIDVFQMTGLMAITGNTVANTYPRGLALRLSSASDGESGAALSLSGNAFTGIALVDPWDPTLLGGEVSDWGVPNSQSNP
jgi:hypothetical protein